MPIFSTNRTLSGFGCRFLKGIHPRGIVRVRRYRLILAKRILLGFFGSAVAVIVTVWAINTYAGRVSPFMVAGAASLATFYTMTLALRGAVREAYRAGEVGRRLPRSVEQRAIGREREIHVVPGQRVTTFKSPPMIQTEYVGSASD